VSRSARDRGPERHAGGDESRADDVGFPLAAADGLGLLVVDDLGLESTL
jgi:hypothetical protein